MRWAAMTYRRSTGMADAVSCFGAFTGTMVLTVVLGGVHRWIPAIAAGVALCLFVFVWSLWTSLPNAAVLIVCAALFGDGFIANRLGVLSWAGVVDLEWLGALIGAAMAGLTFRYVAIRSARLREPVPAIRFLNSESKRSIRL